MVVLHGILTGYTKTTGLNKYSDMYHVLLRKHYSRQEGCVSQALNFLNWPTLEHRRKVNRLTLMYKTLHGQAAISIPPHVKHQTVTKTQNSDSMKFTPVETSCDEYKYSFWPRTINDFNSLPPNIINLTVTSNFKVAVNNYILT